MTAQSHAHCLSIPCMIILADESSDFAQVDDAAIIGEYSESRVPICKNAFSQQDISDASGAGMQCDIRTVGRASPGWRLAKAICKSNLGTLLSDPFPERKAGRA